MPVDTGEPTYTDDNGVERPGSQSMTGVVNPTTVKAADAAWADHYADNQQRGRLSAQMPHITDPYSPLEHLINAAIQDFGNMSVDTIDGSLRLMLLRKANMIIEDVRVHPYGSLPDLNYYVSLQDTRPIPDIIMIAGLAYHYADWMKSKYAAKYERDYYKTLSLVLYQRKYGSGKIQMNTIDKLEASE